VYVQSTYIQQAWVHGDSLHDFVILFAVVDHEKIQKLMEEHKITDLDVALQNKEIKMTVYKDVMALA
jgi:hypothetical protein